MNISISDGCRKTAISIDGTLLAEIENLAEEMNVSRSWIFSLAAREFIEAYRNRQIISALNTVYQAEPDEEKRTVRDLMKRKQYRTVKGQW